MRTQVRIVAGTLRGRKLTCNVSGNLRPTPQMVREAFFSVLGNAIPNRPFFDVFAGTGVVGMEAISRGASGTTFIERDFQLLADLEKHVREFNIQDNSRVVRADVYRWAERWQPPAEPVNLFLSPPFIDYERRLDELLNLVRLLQEKVALESVLVLQGEHDAPLEQLPRREEWEDRRYGRNHLLIWVREEPEANPPTEESES
jgi:16S rRNA (guanine(966)-N(2))-methyltransferase RsmD